jgi:hypothetical protein
MRHRTQSASRESQTLARHYPKTPPLVWFAAYQTTYDALAAAINTICDKPASELPDATGGSVEGRWRSRRVAVGLYNRAGEAITDIKTVELNSSSQQPSEREFSQSLTIAMSHPPDRANLIVRDADDENELVREAWTISLSIINDFGDF